ncbi:hypothetical protein [Arcobacter sp. FWKO B]|uniref:hypothetical protein n=1 Tax=Arcobacter sp. FWKO B TaxID=2593672 RepID=UPI0018A480A5|nr:hypothetical protein [Arcobacter sp. FWKO B]QOG11439.1 hypothetical protein FWKOB_01465 [Arcobacter sp. FWKO B]
MKKKIVFHINHLAYSFEVDDSLEKEMTKFLPKDINLSVQELLAAYVRKSQECLSIKTEVEKISSKLPKL